MTSNNEEDHNNKLKEKLDISPAQVVADIYNAVLDTVADSVDRLEKEIVSVHETDCHKNRVDDSQRMQERKEISDGLNLLFLDAQSKVDFIVDQFEQYATGVVFHINDSYDLDAVKKMYLHHLNNIDSSSNSNNTELTNKSSNEQDNNDPDSDLEIIRLRQMIQSELRRKQVLSEENQRMQRAVKLYEEHLGKFEQLEQIPHHENVESLDGLVKELVISGKELSAKVNEYVKVKARGDTDLFRSDASAFHAHMATDMLNLLDQNGGSNDDLQRFELKYGEN